MDISVLDRTGGRVFDASVVGDVPELVAKGSDCIGVRVAVRQGTPVPTYLSEVLQLMHSVGDANELSYYGELEEQVEGMGLRARTTDGQEFEVPGLSLAGGGLLNLVLRRT